MTRRGRLILGSGLEAPWLLAQVWVRRSEGYGSRLPGKRGPSLPHAARKVNAFNCFRRRRCMPRQLSRAAPVARPVIRVRIPSKEPVVKDIAFHAEVPCNCFPRSVPVLQHGLRDPDVFRILGCARPPPASARSPGCPERFLNALPVQTNSTLYFKYSSYLQWSPRPTRSRPASANPQLPNVAETSGLSTMTSLRLRMMQVTSH